MKRAKNIAFKTLRKGAHLSGKALTKGLHLSNRVENKSTRIILGIDSTVRIHDQIPFEQLLYDAIPEITPIYPALPRVGRIPAVTLFIPSLQKSSFFGGTATALIFSAELAKKKNINLRVVETLVHGGVKADQLANFLAKQLSPFDATKIEVMSLAGRKYNHYGYLDMHPDDIFVASAWWDAHLISRLPLNKKYVYLIQDYEPIFYNNSDQSVYAEATYHDESFIPVCNTELMLDFMKSKNYKYIEQNGLFFEPAVGIKKSKKIKKSDKKTLFIYGRPSVHRNLFYTALDAVNEAFSTNSLVSSEWDVFMAGQDSIPDIILEGGVKVKNLGKLSLDEYYNFASEVDLAISLMLAPHPSYPPLELASLGVKVITTCYETKQDLTRYSANITTTKPERGALLSAITTAATNTVKGKASIGSDWGKAIGPTVEKIASLV